MGGAWASDDHAMDEISATDDDAIAVDSVDDTQKDTSTIKENLTSQKNNEAVKAADSESNQKGDSLWQLSRSRKIILKPKSCRMKRPFWSISGRPGAAPARW